MTNLITGYRFRVTHGAPQYNNKIGTAIAFDERCGTVYISFKSKGIRGHIISVRITSCKTVGKFTPKF